MKLIIRYLLVLFIGLITCVSCTDSGKSWKYGTYVNEFNEPTKELYLYQSFSAYYLNDEGCVQTCKGKIRISCNSIDFQISDPYLYSGSGRNVLMSFKKLDHTFELGTGRIVNGWIVLHSNGYEESDIFQKLIEMRKCVKFSFQIYDHVGYEKQYLHGPYVFEIDFSNRPEIP